jgi:hypothetical protein
LRRPSVGEGIAEHRGWVPLLGNWPHTCESRAGRIRSYPPLHSADGQCAQNMSQQAGRRQLLQANRSGDTTDRQDLRECLGKRGKDDRGDLQAAGERGPGRVEQPGGRPGRRYVLAAAAPPSVRPAAACAPASGKRPRYRGQTVFRNEWLPISRRLACRQPQAPRKRLLRVPNRSPGREFRYREAGAGDPLLIPPAAGLGAAHYPGTA